MEIRKASKGSGPMLFGTIFDVAEAIVVFTGLSLISDGRWSEALTAGLGHMIIGKAASGPPRGPTGCGRKSAQRKDRQTRRRNGP